MPRLGPWASTSSLGEAPANPVSTGASDSLRVRYASENDHHERALDAPEDAGCPLLRASQVGVADDYEDSSEYSADGLYRWWYERRWADGDGLCWVGLNPSTGDTTGRPRPTLRKIVARAQQAGLAAVTVVNLFSWRATRPSDLKRAAALGHDIVGARTDDVIADLSRRSRLTLAAWGVHGSLLNRGRSVATLLNQPVCLGTTTAGEPRHPLYVAATTETVPYKPS